MSTEPGRNRVKQREHMLLSFERPAASRPFCATPCCGSAWFGIAKSFGIVPKASWLEVRALCRTLKTAQLANESGTRIRRIRHRAESFPRSQAHWVITEPCASGVASRGGAGIVGL